VITIPSLENLCSRLSQQKLDWERILERFKNLSQYNPNKYLSGVQYSHEFSEICLDLFLEELITEGVPIELVRYSEENPLIRGNYRLFNNNRGRIIITNKTNNYEFDQIAILDEIPMVFEIKNRKWNTGISRNRRLKNGTYKKEKNDSIINNLRHEVYERKLKPVKKVFGRDVGYIIIIPADLYILHVQNESQSDVVHNFLQQNGQIVPFYMGRLKFHEDVISQIRKWKFPLRE